MPSNVLKSGQEVLEVPLKPDELSDRGESLANIVGRIEELEDEESKHRALFKAKRDDLEEKVKTLSGYIRRKSEPRMVAIEEVADYRSNRATTIRKDTGEVLRERALTTDEMQAPLFPVRGGRKTADAGEP
jgi:uncharacterized coiled-coil DUF342 family protein